MVPTIMEASSEEMFAQQMIGMLNQAALALMTSIGHRTGLFDTMGGWSLPQVRKLPLHQG
jgi:hypothetical protein